MKIQSAVEIDSGITGLKVLVSGMSGAGKTTLGARTPDALILLTERNGLPAIQMWNPEAKVVMLDTADNLRSTLRDLRLAKVDPNPDGKGPALMVGDIPVRTVVLDSVTDLQVMLRDEMMSVPSEGGSGGKSSKETMTMQEWGILIDRTMRLVRAFRDLPCNLLALFLAEEASDGDNVIIRPQLYGKKLPGQIQQFFSGSGYLYRSESVSDDDEDGNKTTKRTILWDGDRRFLVKPVPGFPARTTADFGKLLSDWTDLRNSPPETVAEAPEPKEGPPEAEDSTEPVETKQGAKKSSRRRRRTRSED